MNTIAPVCGSRRSVCRSRRSNSRSPALSRLILGNSPHWTRRSSWRGEQREGVMGLGRGGNEAGRGHKGRLRHSTRARWRARSRCWRWDLGAIAGRLVEVGGVHHIRVHSCNDFAGCQAVEKLGDLRSKPCVEPRDRLVDAIHRFTHLLVQVPARRKTHARGRQDPACLPLLHDQKILRDQPASALERA